MGGRGGGRLPLFMPQQRVPSFRLAIVQFVVNPRHDLLKSQEYFADTFPDLFQKTSFCIEKNNDSLQFSPGHSHWAWHLLPARLTCSGELQAQGLTKGKFRCSIESMFSQKINLFCLFCFPSHSAKVGSCTAAPKTLRICYTTKTFAENPPWNSYLFLVLCFGFLYCLTSTPHFISL